MITDPKTIMQIIIEEFDKQMTAHNKYKGWPEDKIKEDMKDSYKKVKRIAAVAAKRIVNEG